MEEGSRRLSRSRGGNSRNVRRAAVFATATVAVALASGQAEVFLGSSTCAIPLIGAWIHQRAASGRCAQRTSVARNAQSLLEMNFGDGSDVTWRGLNQKVDPNKTYVKIVNPSMVKKGRELAPYHEVFRKWRAQIKKPGFALNHAAKAIRLLPKCRFLGLEEDNEVWASLMSRTKEFLHELQREDSEQPFPGHHVAVMILSAATLRSRLPFLRQTLMPSLLPLVPRALPELGASDVAKLVQAASELCEEGDTRLWDQLPPHLGVIGEAVSQLSTEEVLNVAAVLFRESPSRESPFANGDHLQPSLLTALRKDVLSRLEDLKLPQLALALECVCPPQEKPATDPTPLEPAEGLEELLSQTSTLVSRQAKYWNTKEVDPHLWRIVMVFARHRRVDAPLMKAIARRAIREELVGLTGWSVAALSYAYDALAAPKDGFGDFRRMLNDEVKKRGFTVEEIASSISGPDGGGDAELRDFWAERGPLRAEKPIRLAPQPHMAKRIALASAAAEQSESGESGEVAAAEWSLDA